LVLFKSCVNYFSTLNHNTFPMSVFEKLLKTREEQGAGYWVLLDPDKLIHEHIPAFMEQVHSAGVDGILIGGSLLINSDLDNFVGTVKEYSDDIPVILFPGGVHQITSKADAILFLSLISGRDAQHIIGSQVIAAPLIYRSGLEAISTAYMMIDSGRQTSAQFMTGTVPLPRNKPEIAVAHALAAQYLGFKLIYLEGGSGADMPVPKDLVQAVSSCVSLPIIVGGGIRTPEDAQEKVIAGASFIVTGNILEISDDPKLMKSLSEAIHYK
jgi:phosphoglycerol geranylgeranyltransferase